MSIKYEHLLGFQFDHGSRDCYELARDFYRDNWGIELRNHARPDDWWLHGMNLYMDFFYGEGFRTIDIDYKDLRPGDGFLMHIDSDVANHCAMYLGGDEILHHRYGRLSEVETFSAKWRRRVLATLRHPQVILKPEDKKTIQLEDILPPSFKIMFEPFMDQVRVKDE